MITIKEKNYLSVKEFAASANISDKAVYQQLKTRLKEYIENINGITYICESALERFYGDFKETQVKLNQVDLNLESTEQDKYITYLEQEIREYKEQLQEKDKTINDMQQKIFELSNKVIDISSESMQQIASITKNIQLLQAAEVKEDIVKNQEEIIEEQPKKSWLSRLMGK